MRKVISFTLQSSDRLHLFPTTSSNVQSFAWFYTLSSYALLFLLSVEDQKKLTAESMVGESARGRVRKWMESETERSRLLTYACSMQECQKLHGENGFLILLSSHLVTLPPDYDHGE